VLLHHERYDGRGYPRGIGGDQLPLGAQIIAVADAFDAMTAARPYRPALSVDEALAELRRGKGIQWHPEVVAALASLTVAEGQPVPSGTPLATAT
jgi:HD-GYP domain-containing protein (c-di-GMP phosphodiesterase class II)